MPTDWKKETQKCKKSFTYFAERYCLIRVPLGVQIIELSSWQKEIVKQFEKNQYVILNKPRQGGASTVFALHALWKALFNRHEIIIFVSCNRTSARELIHKVRVTYDNLPRQLRGHLLAANNTEMEFASMSRIISREATLNCLCADTPTLVVFDEAAFFDRCKFSTQKRYCIRMEDNTSNQSIKEGDDLAAELFYAVELAINLGSRCIMASSKNTENDFFWKTFEDAKTKKNQFHAIGW